MIFCALRSAGPPREVLNPSQTDGKVRSLQALTFDLLILTINRFIFHHGIVIFPFYCRVATGDICLVPLVVGLHRSCRLILFYLGFTACQDYFILSLVSPMVGRKQEIPEKNHLITCKQNLAFTMCDQS